METMAAHGAAGAGLAGPAVHRDVDRRVRGGDPLDRGARQRRGAVGVGYRRPVTPAEGPWVTM